MYPPAARMACCPSHDTPIAAAAAAARDISYQPSRSAVPPATSRTARAVATRTSGTMATTSTRESATMAQASITPAMTGTYQRGRARSSSSQTARAGTAVPMCPTDSSRMKMPAPSCGASMIPAVIRTLATPSPDVARLLASRAASTSTSV